MITLIHHQPQKPDKTMITNAEERFRSETITLCLDIDTNLALRLRKHSRTENRTQNEMINSILTGYFQEVDNPVPASHVRDFRKSCRKSVSIPAVIELKMANNETQYKPVCIVNMSMCGIGIAMDCKSTRVMDNINKHLPFLIIFNLPGAPVIIHILCKPVHTTTNSEAEIGAAFMRVPDEIQRTLRSQLNL